MRNIIKKVLLVVNIIFAVALLMSYLAVHINPRVFALPAFFGLAYPYLLLVNILLVITWAAFLRLEALISLVIIIIGFNHFLNYIKIGKHAGSVEGTFKVMSYNVRLFNSFAGKKTPNSEKRVFELIKAQQPDIICLQEVYVAGSPKQKDQSIKADLGGKYYSHTKIIGNGKNRYYGIVTYTKFPIVNKGEIIHPGSSSLSIYTDVLIKKDTFRIFNNHLQSFRLKNMERSFFEEMTASDDKETLGEIRSLSVSLKKGFIRRSIQAQLVKDWIDESPYPVIVAGDFNDTPVSYSYRRIRKGLNDSFVKSGYGAGFTYKGNYPANRIDYILYDNNLVSKRFDILKVKYSDHYPVIAWLRKS